MFNNESQLAGLPPNHHHQNVRHQSDETSKAMTLVQDFSSLQYGYTTTAATTIQHFLEGIS